MEFVDKLLKKDPATRMKPAEALRHKWIKQSIDVDHEIGSNIIENLVKCQTTDTLKKEIFDHPDEQHVSSYKAKVEQLL